MLYHVLLCESILIIWGPTLQIVQPDIFLVKTAKENNFTKAYRVYDKKYLFLNTLSLYTQLNTQINTVYKN